MKNRFLKSLKVLLALLLTAVIVFAVPLTANAADPYSVTGTCGKNNTEDINWYAFSDRTMVFLGQGAMADYTLDEHGFSTAPWFSANMQIVANTIFSTKIVVESGITTVGDYAFYLHEGYNEYVKSFMTISSIDLSDTVTSIGKYAFYHQEIENINIPPTVTHIGTNAFSQCSNLDSINYYGDPAQLTWDHEAENEAEFSGTVTCHILNSYTAEQVSAFETKFSNIGLRFSPDLQNPYANAEDGVDRNIALYYGATNSKVFAGAAPYIVVGKFNGNKKSTTFGSNGFVSCVMYNNNYYLMTDLNGTLKAADRDSNGKVTSCGDTLDDLSLTLTHSYIGSNIVKVVYSLKNNTQNTLSGIMLGGSGDIKIGADDRAAIHPLKNNNNTQVGFYMSSSNDYDKSGNEYATLGFIADNIIKDPEHNISYPDADFFYGKVGANLSSTAAGTRDKHVFPQRIFEKNTSADYPSYDTQDFPQGADSGMSYHWDSISLDGNETKEFAVLYSIYGNSGDGKAMIDDLTASYHTVTWKDYDGTVLQKQAVKDTVPSPEYTGATPTRSRDADNNSYAFSGWNVTKKETFENVECDTEYTATYTSTAHPLFCGHSLTLRGDIGVNFFVDVSPEQVKDGVRIQFDWYDQQSSYTLTEADNAGVINGKTLYRARCNVAAAEMTDTIYATAYFNNVEYTNEYDNYSVRAYGSEIINPTNEAIQNYAYNKPTEYSNLVSLVKAMLDYGAKAQVIFDHNNSETQLANYNIGYQMTTIDADEINTAIKEANGNREQSNMSADTADFGLTYYTSSVVFLSKASLRHYYTIENQSVYDTAKTSPNFTNFIRKEDKLPYVYFEAPNDISASQLDTLQRLTFTIDENTYYYDYSVLDFARSLLTLSEKEQNLGMAIYWYNQYANDYFKD